MKRFIGHLVLFGLIFTFIFSFLNIYQSHHRYEAPHYQLNYDELLGLNQNHQNINGVIIGTSHSAFSIRPSVLDKTKVKFYNFSYGRSNPKFYLKWYDEFFIQKYPNVQYCIISIDNFFFTNKSGRKFEQDSEYFNASTIIELLRHENINKTSLLLNHFPAFKYRKKSLHSVLNKDHSTLFDMDKFDRGFIPYNRPFKEQNFKRKTALQSKISNSVKEEFNGLLNRFLASGTKVIFVMPPEYNLSQGQYLELKEYIDFVSEKHNIPFLDFNNKLKTSMLQNIENYSDFGHLNATGSKLFSEALADAIGDVSM